MKRHEVLSRVERKELTLREAAELMGVSYAQAKRLRRRRRELGAAGLRHGNAGRRSNRAMPERLREQVLEVVREEYAGRLKPYRFEGGKSAKLAVDLPSDVCNFRLTLTPTLFRRQLDRVSHFNTLLPEGNCAHGCLEASLDVGLTGSQSEQTFSD